MKNLFKLKRTIFLCLLVILNNYCSPRNLTYFYDLPEDKNYSAKIVFDEPKIQPHDLLSITVNSLNPESNLLFNTGVITMANSNYNLETPMTTVNEGYVVDKEGNINFPVLGKFNISGLTKEEASKKLSTEIKSYINNPIINVRFQNFRITVIGEVNKPSTFTLATERVNILEAIGMAGDLTLYGKRENILLIREIDGIRSVIKLNLNSKELFESPYYHLKQNDVVYVEPDRMKHVQASTNQKNLTIAGMGVTILVALIFNFQNIF